MIENITRSVLKDAMFNTHVEMGNLMNDIKKLIKKANANVVDTSNISDAVTKDFFDKANLACISQTGQAKNILDGMFNKFGYQLSTEQDSHGTTRYRLREGLNLPGHYVSKEQAYERVNTGFLPN